MPNVNLRVNFVLPKNDMPIHTLHSGKLWQMVAWEERGRCAILTTLEDLEREGSPDSKKLWALIVFSGDKGPPNNESKCRRLRGCDKAWEFKASGGNRIAWCYGQEKTILMTHCFRHGDPIQAQCRKLDIILEKYLTEVKHG